MNSSLPRRVLMTADTLGGVWTYAMELCRALAGERIEVLLATMGRYPDTAQRQEAEAIRGLQLHASEYKLEWMEDPWNDVQSSGRWLLRLADEFRPDLVHLNEFSHAALLWDAPVLVVAHSCVLSWWRAVKNEDPPEAWATYHGMVRAGLRMADLVAAPSQAMLDTLAQNYGRLRHSVVLRNGRSPELFRRDDKQELVLGVGRIWDEAKDLALLGSIARDLPWKVCLAGESRHPDGRSIQPPHVECLGKLAPLELSEWYAKAGIFCHPARYEPFGLSILEAALSGCALVLSDIPSLRELWDGSALFVPPGDAEALRSGLLDLMLFSDQREYLGRRARRRALHYTSASMAGGYLRVYRGLVQQYRESQVAMPLRSIGRTA